MEHLLIISILPSLIIAFLIYKSDRKEKEPIKELIKASLLGVMAVVLTVLISYILRITEIDLLSGNLIDKFIYSFITIAAVEEISKWICGYLFLKQNQNYNYLFDGIVYFVFISIGFATVENILYTIPGGISTGIIRAITTVPAHAFFAIFSGYYFSFYKKEKIENNNTKAYTYLLKSILLPIILHGFYDFCLLTQNIIFFTAYVIFVVTLYTISIAHTKKMMEMDSLFIKK